MKKKITFFAMLACLALCIIVTGVRADVEIELSIASALDVDLPRAKQMFLGGASAASTGKKVTMKFTGDAITVKSGTFDMLIYFPQKTVTWTEIDEGNNLISMELDFKALRQRGESVSEYFVGAGELFVSNPWKKVSKNIKFKDEEVTKWRSKKKKALTKYDSYAWTLPDLRMGNEVIRSIERFVEETGLLISVQRSDEWIGALLELGELPVVYYHSERTKAPMGAAKIFSQRYIFLSRVDGKVFVTASEAKKFVAQKTLFEKIEGALSWAGDKRWWIAPIAFFTILLLIIFSPAIAAWVGDILSDRADSSSLKKKAIRDDITRLHNSLNAIKAELGNANLSTKRQDEINYCKNFKENRLFNKYFTKSEKNMFTAFVDSVDEDSGASRAKHDNADSIDKLLKRCDVIIAKHY